MKVRKLLICILATVFALSAAGCKSPSREGFPDNQKLNVAASFYTMYDFASKIGGDKVNLITIVPSGMEPHDFEPKTGDITRMRSAKVFIYNGAGMENWVDKVISSANNKELITVEASKGVSLIDESVEAGAEKDNKVQKDPHVWLDPKNAMIEMSAIKDAFIKADPDNKTYYENNFETYKAKFNQLDNDYREAVTGFKEKNIVVAHAAFGYLCNAYGLKQVPIEGLGAESEPTAARMAEISKFVKDNNIKVIFFEELVSPKVAKALANETGAGTEKLNPLEGITEDESKNGKEYISIMRDNLDALQKALK